MCSRGGRTAAHPRQATRQPDRCGSRRAARRSGTAGSFGRRALARRLSPSAVAGSFNARPSALRSSPASSTRVPRQQPLQKNPGEPPRAAPPPPPRLFSTRQLWRGDNLYRGVAKALYEDELDLSDKKTVLARLREDGFWLIDAVDEPINKKTRSERRRLIRASLDDLVERVVALAPTRGVIICHLLVYEVAAQPLRRAGVLVLHDTGAPLPDRQLATEVRHADARCTVGPRFRARVTAHRERGARAASHGVSSTPARGTGRDSSGHAPVRTAVRTGVLCASRGGGGLA